VQGTHQVIGVADSCILICRLYLCRVNQTINEIIVGLLIVAYQLDTPAVSGSAAVVSVDICLGSLSKFVCWLARPISRVRCIRRQSTLAQGKVKVARSKLGTHCAIFSTTRQIIEPGACHLHTYRHMSSGVLQALRVNKGRLFEHSRAEGDTLPTANGASLCTD
jgi:hypothetical protein